MRQLIPSSPIGPIAPIARREPDSHADALAAAFAGALEAAEALQRRLPGERAHAGLEAGELLALPPAERRRQIERCRRRFRSPVLAEHLIAAGRDRLPRSPGEAAELASLALRVVDRAEPGVYGRSLLHELRIRARAHRADALRATGDLTAADRTFRRLSDELHREPLLDPHARGEIFCLLARLRRDQQRPSFALLLMRRATALLRRAGGAATPEVRLSRLWPRPVGARANLSL